MWNIDQTLVDVARVSRASYAEAFRRVTGRPLVALPQLAGTSESEIFYNSLAINGGPAGSPGQGSQREAEDLLAKYLAELAQAFAARRELLPSQGRALPGAREALAAVSRLPGVIQTVVTGSIKPNAAEKLRAFGLDAYLDLSIGGFGSDVYPKGTQIVRSLTMAAEKYGVKLAAADGVYLADSTRDMSAAKIGGVRPLGVATGRSTTSELEEAGAEIVLRDLSDTRRVLAAISG